MTVSDEIIRTLAEQGLVIVPREATEKVLQAYWNSGAGDVDACEPEVLWPAMIEAVALKTTDGTNADTRTGLSSGGME